MRVLDCPHSTEQSAFLENAHLEWMACLSCGARWSRRTGPDDIQVMRGLTMTQPQSVLPLPRSGLTVRPQLMTNKTETFFGMQPFPTVQKGGARTTCYGTCFTVSALVFCGATLGGAGDVGGLRFRRLGRELASACGTFQPNHNQNRNSCWNSCSFCRLLASRVSKLSGRSYRCVQMHSTG